MAWIAPYDPVADWRAMRTGDGFGNLFDPVTGAWATVTRATTKTARRADGTLALVPAGQLAVEPWSLHRSGGVGWCAVIEESRTNKYLDSYFAAATITDAWASDVTLERTDELTPVYGTHAAKATYTGTAGDVGATKVLIRQDCVYTAGNAVTTSAYLRGSVSGCAVEQYIEARNDADALLGTVTAAAALTSAWTRGTATYASLPATSAKTRSGMRATGVDEGDAVTLYESAAASELGAFATSYIPTTTAAATRNADVVTVPTTGWAASAGTFVAVAKKRSASSGTEYLVACGPDAANRLVFYHQRPSNIAMFAKGGDNVAAEATASGVDASAQVFVGTWDMTTLMAYVDGSAGSPAATDETTAIPGTSYIGSNGSQYFYGSIARITVYAEALTGDQLASADMTTGLVAGCVPRSTASLIAAGAV